ncbi:MAG: hypothetical protein HY742_10125 [Deltaproteobacteria bacterium]|nr:hypothetical protein [Deltaproteobacteria bacterium]
MIGFVKLIAHKAGLAGAPPVSKSPSMPLAFMKIQRFSDLFPVPLRIRNKPLHDVPDSSGPEIFI